MGRAERIVALVAWTILASFLSMGFGMVLGEAVALTVARLGLGSRPDLDLVVHLVRALAGVGMLGISRIYRMTAARENAGSLAAWLAGWALVLYAGASMVALVDEQAAPLVLIMVLSVWVLVRLSRYFAHYDVDEDEQGDEDPAHQHSADGRSGGSNSDDDRSGPDA